MRGNFKMSVYNKIYNNDDWDKVNNENKLIVEDFLLEKKSQGKKESTLVQYRNDLRIILIYILKNCNNKSLMDLVKRDFRNLILWFSHDLEVSNARTNRLMSAVRSLLDFVEDDDDNYREYINNPSKKVKGLTKESVRNIVFMPNELIEKLREKFIEENRYQEATLLCLAYESAGRKGELAQVLKSSFLKDGSNSTNEVIGKRGKKFQLIFFSQTARCAKLYLEQRGEDDIPGMWIESKMTKDNKKPVRKETLYDWVVKWRKDIFDICGEEYDINVHSFRHSALENMSIGTHWICKDLGVGNVPIEKLKTIANHESIETTSSYLQDKSTQELETFFNIKIN